MYQTSNKDFVESQPGNISATVSVSHQLMRWKGNPIFCQLKYLIEGTVDLIQQVDSIEYCSDI